MSSHLLPCLAAALLLATAGSAAGDDSIEQLRAENARLRAQLQQLQQSCPAPAAAAAAAPAPATPVASFPPPPSPPAPPPVPAAGVQVQAPPAGTPPPVASVAVPAGYKLVPVATPDYVDPLKPPYDRTGCSRDLFKGPPPARWNDADNWLDVSKGQDMAEVEKALGKEHFDAAGRGLVEWQYGKCADRVAGRVVFRDGKVVSLQVPDLR